MTDRNLAERAIKARAGMVEALRAAGAVSDPVVLEAMSKVPREVFVPRFWSLPPALKTGGPADVRQWHVGDGDGALGLVYDIDRALAIRRQGTAGGPTAGGGVTSTASAPRIVASMLELLELSKGMRVLEIGAGSGYNAALLRELVGPTGSVVSVDIDGDLVAEASRRLQAHSYSDVEVVAADGYFGHFQRAPFDRVVATVGCVDVAPAWLDQLAPGGFCLIPLQHGGMHPLTRIEPSGGQITGAVVGRAGFVAIQGYQAGRSPWPRAGRLGPGPAAEWGALPDRLADELAPEAGRQAIGGRRMWDLAYFLALEDRRAAFLLSLAEEDSSANVDAAEGRIGWTGPAGPVLRDELLVTAERWIAIGRPGVADYTSVFVPLGAESGSRPAEDDQQQQPPVQRWSIDRVDYRQIVRAYPRPGALSSSP